jgi:hypothetical protein
MSRNQYRLLNDQQIADIKKQIASDLKQYSDESAEALMNFYLTEDADGLFDTVKDWVETAEDEVIRQINSDLMEDSFDDYYPVSDMDF